MTTEQKPFDTTEDTSGYSSMEFIDVHQEENKPSYLNAEKDNENSYSPFAIVEDSPNTSHDSKQFDRSEFSIVSVESDKDSNHDEKQTKTSINIIKPDNNLNYSSDTSDFSLIEENHDIDVIQSNEPKIVHTIPFPASKQLSAILSEDTEQDTPLLSPQQIPIDAITNTDPITLEKPTETVDDSVPVNTEDLVPAGEIHKQKQKTQINNKRIFQVISNQRFNKISKERELEQFLIEKNTTSKRTGCGGGCAADLRLYLKNVKNAVFHCFFVDALAIKNKEL